ncbi:MAG: ribbon-helix-helix domain-containing protein [Crenarchaeota archaeon]|nr:ribbon-helix-helix domain-containing protein [Thermoproteota archaeon]
MEPKPKPGSDHITIKLPKELVEEMDRLIGVKGFRSRGEIAKEAIRQLLNQYKESLTPPQLPLLEHFNISENGVRILDRALANGYSRGRIVDVYFKPDCIICEYCGTDNCRHVQFALTIPKVREILSRKDWPISKRIKEE